jgi:hypothetical protein
MVHRLADEAEDDVLVTGAPAAQGGRPVSKDLGWPFHGPIMPGRGSARQPNSGPPRSVAEPVQ